jgi:hypothetical protein
VRRTLPFLLFTLAGVASADRVITVPRGGKIPYGTVRGEYMFEPSNPGTFLSYVGIGVTTFIDAEVQTDQLRDDQHFTSLNLNFNLNAPLAGLAPGISFGVLDATNVSPEGRREYVAVSFQDSGDAGPLSGGASVETTIGAFVGRTSHMFVGVSLPVSERFRFLAEHDGHIVSAGAEFKPTNGTYFRMIFRSNETLLSVGTTAHF